MQMLKGTLDVLILRTVSGAPLHGYAVSRFIREASDAALKLEEGALYPALRRLEKKGWLEGHWQTTETGREARFYRLTPVGRQQLEVEMTLWRRYVETMDKVLSAPLPGSTAA